MLLSNGLGKYEVTDVTFIVLSDLAIHSEQAHTTSTAIDTNRSSEVKFPSRIKFFLCALGLTL